MSNCISFDTHGLPHLSRRLAFMDADFGTFSKLLYIRPLQNEVLLLKFFGSFFQERTPPRRAAPVNPRKPLP